MTAITVQGLRKAYESHEAVRGVSFEVQPGEVFCLLGPNGAGKTTTVEILEGHRRADAGRAIRARSSGSLSSARRATRTSARSAAASAAAWTSRWA